MGGDERHHGQSLQRRTQEVGVKLREHLKVTSLREPNPMGCKKELPALSTYIPLLSRSIWKLSTFSRSLTASCQPKHLWLNCSDCMAQGFEEGASKHFRKTQQALEEQRCNLCRQLAQQAEQVASLLEAQGRRLWVGQGRQGKLAALGCLSHSSGFACRRSQRKPRRPLAARLNEAFSHLAARKDSVVAEKEERVLVYEV